MGSLLFFKIMVCCDNATVVKPDGPWNAYKPYDWDSKIIQFPF